MSLSIAGHLKEKEREENKIATHVDPKKPRTEFKIDPDRELTNHRLSVKSVNPDIISDIDSIDEMVVDLDSNHEKKLLAKMERNRQEILDGAGEEVSYYDNSDLYSDISRNQPTVATGAETSRKDSDLSSELSSLVEMSPSHSEENLQKDGDKKNASTIKLTPSTAVQRVSISNPAPILPPSGVVALPLDPPLVSATTTAPSAVEAKAVQLVDMDDIPEIFSVSVKPAPLKQDSSKPAIAAAPVHMKHLREKSYDEDSIDDLSEISLPGLESSLPKDSTIAIKKDQQIIPTPQAVPVATLSQPLPTATVAKAPLLQQSSRPVNIDDDHSRASSNNSQKMVNEEDKIKYEKEIMDLKLRIHRIERENNEMVSHASEKLKQYEYLENLAKSEMLNYPNKTSNIVQQPTASVATIASSVNNLSIYKQYEDLKKDSESKIENLNIRLKEEISKTARFTVLKIQNDDQAKEITYLEGEVKDLKEQNLHILNQLSIAKRENLAAQQLEREKRASKDELGSKRDLGELGFVHEQKKKWQGHSRSSSNLLSGSKDLLRAASGDMENNVVARELEILALKQELEKVKSSLNSEAMEKTRKENAFNFYQQSVEKIASQLAASKLSFEQKDNIMVELQQIDQTDTGLFIRIKQSFQTILENIHQADLQDHAKDIKHAAELEKLTGRISEVESESLKQWDDFKDEKINLTTKIDSLQADVKEAKKKNSDLAAEVLAKESALKRTQSLWESTQADLNKSAEAMKALQAETSKKSKIDTQYMEKQGEYEKQIMKFQNDLYAAEAQSEIWKRELEQQIETAQSLQFNLEESTKTIRELSRKANQHDDLEKLNSDLQIEIQALNSRIVDMQLGENVPVQELDAAKLENEELYQKLTKLSAEMTEMNTFIEHENEVNAEVSARLAESLNDLSGKDEQIYLLSQKLKEHASELEAMKQAEISLKNTNQKLEKCCASLEKEKLNILASKDIEIEQAKTEATSLACQVTDLSERLAGSEKLRQELSQTLKAFHDSESLAKTVLDESKQQLSQKNYLLENLNKNIANDLTKERGEAEMIRNALSEMTQQFEAIKRELDSQKMETKSLEQNLSVKSKRLHEATIVKEKLEAELVEFRSNTKEESSELFEELEALKSQFALKEKQLKQARLENAKIPVFTGSEDAEVKILENEKFKLECNLKMVERELFNEKNRYQTADLKWQETEHKLSAIERTNQLLEKELKSIRLKYEHILGEQTKMDLNTQETVMKLQTKIAEQRQMILDLQLVEQENHILQSQANQNLRMAGTKLKMDEVQRGVLSPTTNGLNMNAEIVDRLVSLETEVQKLQRSSRDAFSTQKQYSREVNDPSNVDSIKRKLQEEFDQGLQEINSALGKVFQTRREVDQEREINQDILRKTYENRLEELSKQIKRRC